MKAYCLTFYTACIALWISCGKAQGAVTISPSGIVSVCSGDQLELTCTITDSGSLLVWNVTLPENVTTPMSFSQAVSPSDPSDQISHATINSAMLTYSRISAYLSFPLISRVLISPVSNHLNGTQVNCVNGFTSQASSVAVISITNGNPTQGVNGVTLMEQFENNDIVVTLEWNQTDSTYSYHVSVIPHLTLNYSTSTRVQIKVPYKSLHNVSVIVSSCGQHNTTIFSEEVFYSKCGNPILTEGQIRVFGFMEPAIEDSKVVFGCPGELVLNGTNISTCMRNGEWEPDPRKLQCSVNCHSPSPPPNGYILPYTNTFEGMMVTYVCWNIHGNGLCAEVNKTAVCTKKGQGEPSADNVCAQPRGTALSQDGIITVASSVLVLIISSVALFIFGYFCGHYRKVQGQSLSSPVTRIPVYEDVLPQHHKQDLELKSNLAYAQTMMK